jgi:hypothetical protein
VTFGLFPSESVGFECDLAFFWQRRPLARSAPQLEDQVVSSAANKKLMQEIFAEIATGKGQWKDRRDA